MLLWDWKSVLIVSFLFCAYAAVPNEDAPGIVQYQEWFSEYATILETTMQIKRQANSNATLYFNKELLKILANVTLEMRLIDNTTESTILQSSSLDQQCQQQVLEMFQIYRTFGQADFQTCVTYVTDLLHDWTKLRFFSYANILHREATEQTHRVSLILEQYNKVTQMDNILYELSEEYY
uniref:Secreted protein n=1 Tax=Anopheles culicifacies TaxID=139723 RepID=A0A182M575_9DIPT